MSDSTNPFCKCSPCTCTPICCYGLAHSESTVQQRWDANTQSLVHTVTNVYRVSPDKLTNMRTDHPQPHLTDHDDIGKTTSTLGAVLDELESSRDSLDRIAMIEDEIRVQKNWTLSGCLSNWGNPLAHHFTLAVFLHLDPNVRMERIAKRQYEHYGTKIAEGGDMQVQHDEFMEWARSYDYAQAPIRSLDLHKQWI